MAIGLIIGGTIFGAAALASAVGAYFYRRRIERGELSTYGGYSSVSTEPPSYDASW